ncbi:hypothetical protein H6P81_004634 [Aristolochia fimbriata]|uniref:PGG domain-containing protein n=1 Tax=Aristolochia fimbriata TaxID=158543 RepID=A0AAV7ES82_ARIFI|nr:hypothetical protein H6P81_004634 [Aristolochia fimbriata]
MFKAAMRGDWEAIKNEFQTDPWFRTAKITCSEDTVLHFAVKEGHRAVVKDLVNLLHGNTEMEKILLSRNKRGNTPLHLAAAQGDAELCAFLATLPEKPNVVSKALEARNEDGETPLFLAALHGKKDAFLLLRDKMTEPISRYYGRYDGNTILHVALLGDHFDLAFQIIHVFKKEEQGKNVAINRHNEKGQSALHVLAKSSHAFRSGYHLGTIEQIIYYLIWADSLEVEKSIWSNDVQNSTQSEYDEKKPIFPENYGTCVGVVKLARKQFQANGEQGTGWNTKDPENPPASPSNGGKVDVGTKKEKKSPSISNVAHRLIPPNYVPVVRLLEVGIMFSLTLLGFGFWKIKKLKDRKQRNTWAVQVMEELVEGASSWEYDADGKRPEMSTLSSSHHDFLESAPVIEPANATDTSEEFQGMFGPGMESPIAQDMRQNGSQQWLKIESETSTDKNRDDGDKSETSILVAAKHGVVEMVEKILMVFPVAIQDETKDGKNIVLLAVEHRQPYVYQLLSKKFMKESVFQKTDNDGNSALHLAATLGNERPWIIPGAALQMQWEIKWYKFVKSSMNPHFFTRLNNKGRTAKEIFTETHRDLVKEGGEWLNNTSESCSVVAALIASVAFAGAVTVPGGVIQDKGTPTLEGRPAFDIFTISSLTALCLSVTSLVMFLSILTSRHVARDFEWSLPRKLMIGLISVFFSIAAILLSFCSGHYFILRNHLKHVAFTMYTISCLPIALFAFAQFPLYFDLMKAILTRVPHRTYKETAY